MSLLKPKEYKIPPSATPGWSPEEVARAKYFSENPFFRGRISIGGIEVNEANIKAMEEQYAKLDPATAEAQERKKQIELLKRRRRRSGTILTSPLGLTGEPTTTSPTLLGGS